MAKDWLVIPFSVYCSLRLIRWCHYIVYNNFIQEKSEVNYTKMTIFEPKKFFLDDPTILITSIMIITVIIQIFKWKYEGRKVAGLNSSYLNNVFKELTTESKISDNKELEDTLQAVLSHSNQMTTYVEQIVKNSHTVEEEFNQISKRISDIRDFVKNLAQRITVLEKEFTRNRTCEHHLNNLNTCQLREKNCGCGDWSRCFDGPLKKNSTKTEEPRHFNSFSQFNKNKNKLSAGKNDLIDQLKSVTEAISKIEQNQKSISLLSKKAATLSMNEKKPEPPGPFYLSNPKLRHPGGFKTDYSLTLSKSISKINIKSQ